MWKMELGHHCCLCVCSSEVTLMLKHVPLMCLPLCFFRCLQKYNFRVDVFATHAHLQGANVFA